MCVCVIHVSAGTHGGERHCIPLELELEIDVSNLKYMLGARLTELFPSPNYSSQSRQLSFFIRVMCVVSLGRIDIFLI